MVHVDQVGYIKGRRKLATITGASEYRLLRADGETVKTGKVSLYKDENSGEDAGLIDFSDIDAAGEYFFTDDSGDKSCRFKIDGDPYDKLLRDAVKMFYFQRCGMALEEKHAGRFAHKACHCKKAVYLRQPEREAVSLEGGWHDAGDFGRYVTAGAVAVGHLLYSFIYSGDVLKGLDVNIPESGGSVPDILSECRYELEWMLKMQESDGGVHHKATSRSFVGFIMPEEDGEEVVITPVSSLATADLAAVAALASRIYADYDREFSERLLEAAKLANGWLEANPGFIFENPGEVQTGTYEDVSDADERLWAAAEWYALTGEERALSTIRRILETRINTTALGWADVGGMASLSVFSGGRGRYPELMVSKLKALWLDEAERLVRKAGENPYGLAFKSHDFIWGSNMVVLENAMVLLVAYELTGLKEERYLDAALSQLDYILGRNALDISFVTGHGERAFRDPHNRPTVADGIDDPIPGFVSGGPNAGACDTAADIKGNLKGVAPMKCYADDWQSYSTNEITIYWNSPLVFVLSYLARIESGTNGVL